MVGGSSLAAPWHPLDDGDVIRVHRAALDLLDRVGMAAPTDRARDLALAHGCRLGDTGRLLYPPSLVEDTLARAARRFTVHGRDRQLDFEARSGTVNFCTGGAAVKMLDIDTRRYRPSTLRDIYDLARLCDTLENIQWFARPVVATDVEDIFESDANTVYACAAGTKKHIATSITLGEHVAKLVPMLDALAGGGFVYESAGMLASLLGCSFEAMIIDDEMLSGIRRIARGIEVSDKTLSVDVIADVVNGPGHFLGAQQTMELMESEFMYPRHADRSSPDDWESAGSMDMWDRAVIRTKEILGTPRPASIEPEVDAGIRDRYAIHLDPARSRPQA